MLNLGWVITMKKLICSLLLLMCGCTPKPLPKETPHQVSTPADTSTEDVINNIEAKKDALQPMQSLDEQLLVADLNAGLPPNEEYIIIDQLPKQLYRRPSMDYYPVEPEPFESAVIAFFYIGEFNEQSDLPFKLFEYIMRSKPTLKPLNAVLENVDSLQYEINGEILTIEFDEPMYGYTMIMPGDEFRKHYKDLLGRDVPCDENHSWLEQQGYTIGYLKNYDMYLYYRYDDGATAGYHGWNMYLYNEQQKDDILTYDAIRYYSTTCYINDSDGKVIYGDKYYDKNWQQIKKSAISEADKVNIEMILMPNRSKFENWTLKFRHNEDDTYALLSATCQNCTEAKAERTDSKLYTIYKREEEAENIPSNTVFQFNLSGKEAYNINEEIGYLCSLNNFAGFIVDEDEQQLILKIVSQRNYEKEGYEDLYIRNEISLDKQSLTFSDLVTYDE